MLENIRFLINIFDFEINRYIFYFSYFTVAMVYLIVNMDGNKRIGRLIKTVFLFLILLFIPFYTNWIRNAFGDNYFTIIFWVFPIGVITCYAAVKWLYQCGIRKDKVGWIVLSLALLVMGGKFAYSDHTGGMAGRPFSQDIPDYLEECEEICSLIAASKPYAQVIGDDNFKRVADVRFQEVNVLEENEKQLVGDVDFYVYNKNSEVPIMDEAGLLFYETEHYWVLKEN